ncbi:Protein of unknown function, DUF547 [Quillaja saponaria]|uniref:DUF547 domain-containing protein n=1 Tax=Quillaja saponaria TaxID=32244 RepID=A0AAD7LLE6_QUISA|nr:Protein of unknown function, DUF547 [Quillaja saponaria]
MKFEEHLKHRSQNQQKRQDLEEEVVKLQAEFDAEHELNRVLRNAIDGSHPCCLSSSCPPQVQVLLAELEMVGEEVILLERKVKELKLTLYQDSEQQAGESGMQQQQQILVPKNQFLGGLQNGLVLNEKQSKSYNYEDFRKGRTRRDRGACLGSALDIQSLPSSRRSSNEYKVPRKSSGKIPKQCHYMPSDIGIENPNNLSEELIKCLIGIFLELNQAPLRREESAFVPKLALSCKKSTGFKSKTSLNCKTPSFLFNDNVTNFDPYGILSDLDCSVRDVGPYKNFVQVTRSSLDIGRYSQCLPAIGKLRVLLHKLCDVDLCLLTYKQKLAFWINIYNACIMKAFLEHGLPSTQDKLLVLMNKATIDVGGIVLTALAIEHFILRHPCESKQGLMDEKEVLLRHAYGLGYPESNITFALCRGSWSSPALRVYTRDEVVNELGRAKVEYLEASVGITSKRKIIVPKLLQWHMQDFADDMKSLLEWIYSHLPRTGSLKTEMMECLIRETKSPISKMVEIQSYESEFRYLLP